LTKFICQEHIGIFALAPTAKTDIPAVANVSRLGEAIVVDGPIRGPAQPIFLGAYEM